MVVVCDINTTLFLYKKSEATLTQTNTQQSQSTNPAVGKGGNTAHRGQEKHNSNTAHALHLFASPWPSLNGIGVIVNLKHKERLKAILSGTARKERERRGLAMKLEKSPQPQTTLDRGNAKTEPNCDSALKIRLLYNNLIVSCLCIQMDGNCLRETSRAQVSIIQVVLTSLMLLLLVAHWCPNSLT